MSERSQESQIQSGAEQTFADIDLQQANLLLCMQNDIMKMVVLNDDHQAILDKLCKMVENLVPKAVASIMVFDDSGLKLRVKAAPSLPIPAREALNGLEPGPHNGSCANAIFHNQPQFVCDTLTDNRWDNVRKFARNFTVGACWSIPINLDFDKAFGSLALSSFEKRQPSEFHRQVLKTAAHIAGIIFQRAQEEDKFWYLAHYDALTDLPNRSLFNLRFEHAKDQAFRSGEMLALLFMDLDQFKEINDTLGHKAGDEVLVQSSQRLSRCVRKEDTLARMGGDEFILLVEGVKSSDMASQIAKKILGQFNDPFYINDIERNISISIGISIYPNHGKNTDILLQNADTAMYQAKSNGPGEYVYFKETHKQQLDERVTLTSEFRKAINNDELFLTYQPQFSDTHNHVVAVEALLRWKHPNKGLILPNEFIPIAEQTGLIRELGLWVLKTACEQCVNWWALGYTEFILAINVSNKQLQNGFSNQIQSVIEQCGFPARLLELEITESLFMETDSDSFQELSHLKNLGVGLAMDDFGTGHSSLAQLKHLPISKLKIDRSFVMGIPSDENDIVIVQTIISMAHTLGLAVVAEGVETKAQRDFLIGEGCDILQGFLFSKPLMVNALEKLLSK